MSAALQSVVLQYGLTQGTLTLAGLAFCAAGGLLVGYALIIWFGEHK